jgi:hypothetical protein
MLSAENLENARDRANPEVDLEDDKNANENSPTIQNR